jgi:ankyrin repeat protein
MTSMSRRKLLIGLFATLAWGAVCTAADIRVAVSDFTTDDNSYQSMLAAENFAAATQAQLGEIAGMEWVERQQWQKAAQELKLTTLSRAGTANALRLGRWVKADWQVRGEFIRAEKEGRILRLEIIDLTRADVLTELTLKITGETNQPLQLLTVDVTACTTALRQALTDATRRWEQVRARPTVAPLFFGNIGKSERLDFLESDLLNVFQTVAAESNDIHVLRFPHSNEAAGEAEFALAGLVDTDPDAWSKLADVFVWGSYSEENGDDLSPEQQSVDVTWFVWDGLNAPQKFTATEKVTNLKLLADRVGRSGIAAARTRHGGRDREAGQVAADLLRERAREIEIMFRKSWPLCATKQGRALWRYQGNALSAARLFAPQDSRIQCDWLGQSWFPKFVEPVPGWFQFDLSSRMEHARDFRAIVENLTLDPIAKIDGQLVDQFLSEPIEILDMLGQSPVNGQYPPDTPEDLKRAWRTELELELLERARAVNSYYLQLLPPQPRYLTQLHQKLIQGSCDYVYSAKTRAQIIEDSFKLTKPGPWLYDNLNKCILQTFAELGQPEKGRQLLEASQLPKPARSPHVDVSWLPAIRDRLVPRLDMLPPRLQPVMHTVRLAATKEPQIVVGLQHWQNKLWVSTQPWVEASPHNLDASARGIPEPLAPLLLEPPESSLLMYDLANGETVNLSDRLGKHAKVTSFAPQGDKLWMTLQGEGVWCLDPTSLAVQRYGTRDGVASDRLLASSAGPTRLYFGGGRAQQGRLAVLDSATHQWSEQPLNPMPQITLVSATSQHQLIAGHRHIDRRIDREGIGIYSYDLQKKTWTNLTVTLFERAPRLLFGHQLQACVPDSDAFWLGTGCGLILWSPARGVMAEWFSPAGHETSFSEIETQANRKEFARRTKQFQRPINCVQPTSRLSGAVTALANDGDFLWVATTTDWDEFAEDDYTPVVFPPSHRGTHRVFLLHKPTRKWVGQFAVPERVTAMTLGADQLWLGFNRAENAIVSGVDRHSLLSTPATQWVTDAIPASELEDKLAALPLVDRSLYAFRMGRYDQVAKLLGSTDVKTASKEVLELLILSCDEVGLNDPGKQRVYLEELQRRAGGNVNFGEIAKAVTPAGPLPLDVRLIIAAKEGKTNDVASLLAQGADINAKDEKGWSPLIHAIIQNQTATAMALIAHKADVNQISAHGSPPIAFAAEHGDLELVRYLLLRGADVNITATNGATALKSAAGGNHLAVVRLLLRNGADVNFCKTTSGKPTSSALIVAAAKGHTEMVWLLIQHGADLELKNNMGCTALHVAANAGETETVELLLAKGASVTARNSYEWTPLMYAAQGGSVAVAQPLLKHGADRNAVNVYGDSALKIAEANHRDDMIEFLKNQVGQ